MSDYLFANLPAIYRAGGTQGFVYRLVSLFGELLAAVVINVMADTFRQRFMRRAPGIPQADTVLKEMGTLMNQNRATVIRHAAARPLVGRVMPRHRNAAGPKALPVESV